MATAPSLADVLLGSDPDPAALDGTREAVDGATPGVDWAVVGDRLLALLPALLDIPVPEIVARGWRNVVALREYTDPERHPPDEESVVALLDHVVHSEHHPQIEVLSGGEVVHTVKLDVAIEVRIEAAHAVIRGGHIHALRMGTVTVAGTVAIAGVTLLERELDELALPGEWTLDEPVPIDAA